MDGYWVELADGVLARRYAELDLTVGLVVGGERALVVDTRGDRAQGAELAAAVRAVTRLPLSVVYTHAHFDHCFGTSALPDRGGVYAHPGCAAALRDSAEDQRAEWVGYYRERGDHDTAEALAGSAVIPPDTLVTGAEVGLGGRVVTLGHPGRGHTDHDLVVHVPDARVLFAGDLVEQGAPPDFTDAHPLDWPGTLGRLRALGAATVVAGHGDPAAPADVARQHGELTALAGLCRDALAGRLTGDDVLRSSPYPASVTRTALDRVLLTGHQETHP
jgi:glyoxylase-like metal-dependent hydrolase (beta-lactamase superfamily II)